MRLDWSRLDGYLKGCAELARASQPTGLPPCAFVAPREIDNVREYVRELRAVLSRIANPFLEGDAEAMREEARAALAHGPNQAVAPGHTDGEGP